MPFSPVAVTLVSFLWYLSLLSLGNAFLSSRKQEVVSLCERRRSSSFVLESSPNFYNDFEDFEGLGDDSNSDEGLEGKMDEAELELLRSRMDNLVVGGGNENFKGIDSLDEFIRIATQRSGKEAPKTDWAVPKDELEAGVVLIGNPAKFLADFGGEKQQPSASLLAKFGLTLPPPADLGPDRRADLLPVLVLSERNILQGSQAVLLNRRTGYLIGDLEEQQDSADPLASTIPKLGAFMIQPLWFGGTSASGESGIDMLHFCPSVKGAKQLTEDGIYWGGDPAQAQEAMKDPSLETPMTGFDFKFFVQCTRWLPTQLEKEVKNGTWFIASVSKKVLFKSRDRVGTRRAKPLWTEIMELLGDDFLDIRDQLYGGENEESS